MVGTADSVLIREVSLIQSVLYREVPLYYKEARASLETTRLVHNMYVDNVCR